MQFTLPFSALPGNKLQRREFLDKYFPSDLIPFEELVDNEWRITSFIPDDPTYYPDPFIKKGLEGWFEQVSVEEMGNYWRIYKNAMLSFNDSWSLLYWSLVVDWLRQRQVPLHNSLILFHVDDHKDFDSPLLTLGGENFECIFSGRKVNFSDPRSIEQALIQKSIDIRSFITPFVYSLPAIDFLHLRYADKNNHFEGHLECAQVQDKLLARGKWKPILKQTCHKTAHQYFLSSEISSLLKVVAKDSTIFLHLDCDGFNNRYNSDSLWEKQNNRFDPILEDIKEKIDELLHQIASLELPVFINVALSPGFFPAEFWKLICKHIFLKAEEYNLIKECEFSQYLKKIYPAKVLDEHLDTYFP